MMILELLLTALSLGTDAFTISICKGIKTNYNRVNSALIISFVFGLFQAIMTIIGYYLGNVFTERIIYYNPYISTILLIVVGILIYRENDDISMDDKIRFWELIFLAIATSIDALVIGISFSFFKINIFSSSLIIGLITFILCIIGFYLGNIFNSKVSKYANKIAGVILIILGIKVLIQNLIK